MNVLSWPLSAGAVQADNSLEPARRVAASSGGPPGQTPGYRTGRNLVLTTLTCVAVVRLFTEVWPVVPRAANFVDIPLLIVLTLFAVGLPRLLGTVPTDPQLALLTLVFAGIWGFSVLLNLSRVQLAPALVFLYGFIAPVVFYLLTLRLWPVGQLRALSRTLVALVLVQFPIVLFIDLPRMLVSGDPDEISGTFGQNPYQLIFFLLIAGTFVAGLATFDPRSLGGRMSIPILVGSFIVIFMAQYRALLVTTALSIIVVSVLLSIPRQRSGIARGRGVFVGVFGVAALVGAFVFVGLRFPVTKFLPTVEAIQEEPEIFWSVGKLAAVGDTIRLYLDDGRFAVAGTGPGTYSSRAWYTFRSFQSTSDSNVAGNYLDRLTGGAIYRTDVSDRYVVPRVQADKVTLGSRALDLPFSSYLALLAEVGLPGFLVMVSIYGTALLSLGRMAVTTLRSPLGDNVLPALLISAFIAMFVLLQMALLENWLESARVTIPAWILAGVATKEFAASRYVALSRYTWRSNV